MSSQPQLIFYQAHERELGRPQEAEARGPPRPRRGGAQYRRRSREALDSPPLQDRFEREQPEPSDLISGSTTTDGPPAHYPVIASTCFSIRN